MGERRLLAGIRRKLADEKSARRFRLAAEPSRLACAPQSCSCRRHWRQNRAEDLPLRTAAATRRKSLPEYLPSSRYLKRALRRFSVWPRIEFYRRQIFYRARARRVFFFDPPRPAVVSATQTLSTAKRHHLALLMKARLVLAISRRLPLSQH